MFLFAPLQSEIGESIINEFNIDTEKTDSIILFDPKARKIYHKSTAALKVAKQLSLPTSLLSVFLVVPAIVRNWVYDYIAKNRYKWYGKKDSCMIPTPELQAKFIS